MFREENIVGDGYCGWTELLFNGWHGALRGKDAKFCPSRTLYFEILPIIDIS